MITAPDEPLPEDILPQREPGVESSSKPRLRCGTGEDSQPPAVAAPSRDGEVRASPIARRLAGERGIDLALINGTGPGGRIVEEDVLGYQEAAPSPQASEVRASPIARRLARERGIDLARITGTGPGGRIIEQDILGYEEAAPATVAVDASQADAATAQRVDLSRMRQTIARVTSDSKREAPPFLYYF